MQTIVQLASKLDRYRSEGRRIVLCHGVFDLLHIGHIRYLKKAKALGDILVVTVTPDLHVNKGPHRPAFPERLRVEAVAALADVDEVALNDWQTAVQTIKRLKPHVYAKGAEFRDRPTPEIRLEMEALDEVQGELVYIEDVTSSSSYLLNKYLSPFPDDINRYLSDLDRDVGTEGILHYLESAASMRVLVVGETIVDEYHYCSTIGQSAKAPIMAVHHLSHESFAGGAASLANDLGGFCQNVGFLSLIGAKESKEEWIRKQLRANVQAEFVYKTDSPTIVKRRYRESYFALPLLEVYVMNESPLTASVNRAMCDRLREILPEYDAVVVADHGYAMMTREMIDVLSEHARFLAVNIQTSASNLGYHTISRYPRVDYICLAEQELRLESRSRSGALQPMIEELAERLSAERLVVTMGKSGCLGYRRETGFCNAPALATQVIDRVGAGNAFLALSALCAAQNAPMDVLTFLGNVAGAEAVATVGTRESLERHQFTRHVISLLKQDEPISAPDSESDAQGG